MDGSRKTNLVTVSAVGQKRQIVVVGDESGLPPIAAIPLHCGEPTFWATTGRAQLQQTLDNGVGQEPKHRRQVSDTRFS